MGYPATAHASIAEVQTAIARVLAACKAAGKFAGMVSILFRGAIFARVVGNVIANPRLSLSSALPPIRSRRASSKDVSSR